MLKQRVITALVLLAVLLPALFHGDPRAFMALMLVFIAAGGWEWGRLNGLAQGASLALGAITLAACGASWGLGWHATPQASLWVPAGVAWVLCGALLLRAGVPGWPQLAPPVRLVGGLLVQQVQYGVLWLIAGGAISGAVVPLLAAFGLVRVAISGLIGLLIVHAILSWVQTRSPMSDVIGRLCAPLLRPVQRVVPLVGGLDLSPLVLLVLLQIAMIVLGHLQAAVLTGALQG